MIYPLTLIVNSEVQAPSTPASPSAVPTSTEVPQATVEPESIGDRVEYEEPAPASNSLNLSLGSATPSAPANPNVEARTIQGSPKREGFSRKRTIVESIFSEYFTPFSVPSQPAHLVWMDDWDESCLFGEDAPASKRQRTAMEEIEEILDIGKEGAEDSDAGAGETKEEGEECACQAEHVVPTEECTR
jgi:hypothetical protein